MRSVSFCAVCFLLCACLLVGRVVLRSKAILCAQRTTTHARTQHAHRCTRTHARFRAILARLWRWRLRDFWLALTLCLTCALARSLARSFVRSASRDSVGLCANEQRRCCRVFAAQTKEQEDKRVAKELAHIRTTFKTEKKLDGYDRKKYVAKLLYIHLLGYEVDFGHMEALHLLSSPNYQEKQIVSRAKLGWLFVLTRLRCFVEKGYMTLGILLHENHDLIPLIVNSCKVDLDSRNSMFQGGAFCEFFWLFCFCFLSSFNYYVTTQ